MRGVPDLRPLLHALLDGATRFLAARQVVPRHLSLAALLLALAAGTTIVLLPYPGWPLLLVPLVLAVDRGLATIGRRLPRPPARNVLSEVLDDLRRPASEAALYLPLALVPGFSPPLVVGVVALALLGEIAALALRRHGGPPGRGGPMGADQRALALAMLTLAMALGARAQYWLDALLIGIAVMLLANIFNRLRAAAATAPAGAKNPDPD